VCVGLEVEQFLDRARLAVAARQHVAGRELVPGVVALDPERLHVHRLIIPCCEYPEFQAFSGRGGTAPAREFSRSCALSVYVHDLKE
jgi:hypothetical protein